MTRRLGAWDCSYCKTKRILGNVFDCPGCGHPRPRGVRFYQIPDGPIVTPEIAKQLGSGGPNWYCNHCDSGNKDDNTKCWNCGAEKGSSPSHKVKKYLQGESVPQSTEEAEKLDPGGKSWVDEAPVIPVAFPTRVRASAETQTGVRFPDSLGGVSPKPFAIGMSIIGGLALMSFLIYQFFFNTRVENVQVSGYSWSQNVVVEEYKTVRESSWTSHPANAYNVESDYRDTGQDKKIHDRWDTVSYTDTCYKPVSYLDTCTGSEYVSKTCTGTTDNGDGSFDTYNYECGSSESYTYSCTKTRQDPYSCTKTRQVEVYHFEDIYDWYYEYDIDKWVNVANYPTSGTDHTPWYFSDFVLKSPHDGKSAPILGQQRQFQVPGEYAVTFFCQDNPKVGEGGYFTRKYSLGEWELFETGIDYQIETNFLNKILVMPVP